MLESISMFVLERQFIYLKQDKVKAIKGWRHLFQVKCTSVIITINDSI